MKTKFFLVMGLLVSVMGFGQVPAGEKTTTLIPTNTIESISNGGNVVVGTAVSPSAYGLNNVFVGYGAGVSGVFQYSKFGSNQISNSVFLGFNAGKSNKKGSSNVFVGCNSGYNNLGNSNVFIGVNAGKNNINGLNNIFLGNYAGENETGSSKLYIENSNRSNPLIYGNFDSGAKEIKFNAKKVGIGFESTLSGTGTNNEGFGDFPGSTAIPNIAMYRLFVRGGILAEEVRVRVQADWADYVFDKDYKLLSLKDTEKFISENGHLPNMPSAQQVKEEGLEFGNISRLQQEKIEELTLHLIEQQKQIEELKARNVKLEALEAKVEMLLNKQ